MQPCLFDFSFIWHAVMRLNGFTSKHHRKAFQKLVRHILLELPLRMSSSKHRNSFIQKSFRLTCCPFLNRRSRKSGLRFDFPVVVSAALPAQHSRARGLSAMSEEIYVSAYILLVLPLTHKYNGSHFLHFETRQRFLAVFVV